MEQKLKTALIELIYKDYSISKLLYGMEKLGFGRDNILDGTSSGTALDLIGYPKEGDKDFLNTIDGKLYVYENIFLENDDLSEDHPMYNYGFCRDYYDEFIWNIINNEELFETPDNEEEVKLLISDAIDELEKLLIELLIEMCNDIITQERNKNKE